LSPSGLFKEIEADTQEYRDENNNVYLAELEKAKQRVEADKESTAEDMQSKTEGNERMPRDHTDNWPHRPDMSGSCGAKQAWRMLPHGFLPSNHISWPSQQAQDSE